MQLNRRIGDVSQVNSGYRHFFYFQVASRFFRATVKDPSLPSDTTHLISATWGNKSEDKGRCSPHRGLQIWWSSSISLAEFPGRKQRTWKCKSPRGCSIWLPNQHQSSCQPVKHSPSRRVGEKKKGVAQHAFDVVCYLRIIRLKKWEK